MKLSLLFIVLSVLPALASGKTVLYVQSAKAKMMENPSYSAPVVTKIDRGTKLDILEFTDRWTKVSYRDNTGWVSSILLSSSVPIQSKSLLSGHKKQLEKTSRRRASNSTTAAATRGLRQGKNARVNHKSAADYSALEEVESIRVDKTEVEAFHKEIK